MRRYAEYPLLAVVGFRSALSCRRHWARHLVDAVAVGLATILLLFPAEAAFGGTVTGTVQTQGRDNANAVVYVEGSSLSLGKNQPDEPVVMDQLNLTFVPHVLPVLVGTKVEFPNSDEVRHNVFSSSPPTRFNLGTYPMGISRSITFDQPGEVAMLCNVHAHMGAYILVLETPYFTVTPRNGSYNLQNLPPGKYTVTAWHEGFMPVSLPVEIKGTETVPLDFRLRNRR